MATSAPNLLKKMMEFLAKEKFPTLASNERALWGVLVTELEAHPGTPRAYIDNHTFGNWEIPKQKYGNSIVLPQGEFLTLLGEAYATLWSKYKTQIKSYDAEIEDWLTRIRNLMPAEGTPQSQVTLQQDATTHFADGVLAPVLSILPDPALGWTFGSQPNDSIIQTHAPAWGYLKRRHYDDGTGKITSDTHYILAHMINDNLNGPGTEPRNLVPLWRKANRQMEAKAEAAVKEVVLRGFAVDWKITAGAAVGLAYVQPVLDAILKKAGITDPKHLHKGSNEEIQYNLVSFEQYLPVSLTMNATATVHGNVYTLVNNEVVNNFIPKTIPDPLR